MTNPIKAGPRAGGSKARGTNLSVAGTGSVASEKEVQERGLSSVTGYHDLSHFIKQPRLHFHPTGFKPLGGSVFSEPQGKPEQHPGM